MPLVRNWVWCRRQRRTAYALDAHSNKATSPVADQNKCPCARTSICTDANDANDEADRSVDGLVTLVRATFAAGLTVNIRRRATARRLSLLSVGALSALGDHMTTSRVSRFHRPRSRWQLLIEISVQCHPQSNVPSTARKPGSMSKTSDIRTIACCRRLVRCSTSRALSANLQVYMHVSTVDISHYAALGKLIVKCTRTHTDGNAKISSLTYTS